MYLGVFEHEEFISEVHFPPKRRNLKILRLIGIPKILLNPLKGNSPSDQKNFFKVCLIDIIFASQRGDGRLSQKLQAFFEKIHNGSR